MKHQYGVILRMTESGYEFYWKKKVLEQLFDNDQKELFDFSLLKSDPKAIDLVIELCEEEILKLQKQLTNTSNFLYKLENRRKFLGV